MAYMDYSLKNRVIDGTGMILDTKPGTPDEGTYVTEDQLADWIKGKILFAGYYHNGDFYSDSGHTTLLAKVNGALYIDQTNANKALYACLSSTYQSLTEEAQVQAIIDGLNDGTIVPLKAKQDQNGNVIDQTYETKADASDLKSAIQANSKRITNLETKAGDEIPVTYPSPTYGMDGVPASVAPYGKVRELIMNSRVKNQLAQNGDFSNGTTGWTGRLSNVSVSNGVATITPISDGTERGLTADSSNSFSYTANHILLLSCLIYSPVSGSVRLSVNGGGTTQAISVSANSWVSCNALWTENAPSTQGKFYALFLGTLTTSQSLQYKNVIVTDLNVYFNTTDLSFLGANDADKLATIQRDYPELLIPSDYDTGTRVDTTYSAVKSYKTDSTELATLSLPAPVTGKSAGSVHQIYYPETGEMTEPLGEYTFDGTEAWEERSTSGGAYYMYWNGLASTIKAVASSSDLGDIFSVDYVPNSQANVYAGTNGIAIGTDGSIRVYDPSYNTLSSASAFATHMTGKTISYALASPNPNSQATDPMPDPFIKVEGGGTIKAVQSQTTQIDSSMSVDYLGV